MSVYLWIEAGLAAAAVVFLIVKLIIYIVNNRAVVGDKLRHPSEWSKTAKYLSVYLLICAAITGMLAINILVGEDRTEFFTFFAACLLADFIVSVFTIIYAGSEMEKLAHDARTEKVELIEEYEKKTESLKAEIEELTQENVKTKTDLEDTRGILNLYKLAAEQREINKGAGRPGARKE